MRPGALNNGLATKPNRSCTLSVSGDNGDLLLMPRALLLTSAAVNH